MRAEQYFVTLIQILQISSLIVADSRNNIYIKFKRETRAM